MPNLETYRSSVSEQERTTDLLRLIPRNRTSVLDIGARDGHFSQLLAQYFSVVTALDLHKPTFAYPGITTVAGDATALEFEDASFNCVFCAEVLEHIPNVEQACSEIARVAKHEVIIGVPYRQDLRLGRTTCRTCGGISPPWGHVNRFDERRLRDLFPRLHLEQLSFVGQWKTATNSLAVALMDVADNPWGTYDQDEGCVHCGARLIAPPEHRPLWSKVCAAASVYLSSAQQRVSKPTAKWIHIRFSK